VVQLKFKFLTAKKKVRFGLSTSHVIGLTPELCINSRAWEGKLFIYILCRISYCR